MRLEDIIVMLESERDAVVRAIDVLTPGGTHRRRRRRLNAASRKRISEGMKRKWAERKKKAG